MAEVSTHDVPSPRVPFATWQGWLNSYLLDTFPAFLVFWEKAQHLPLDTQIEGWASDYMASWPELLEKQIHSYAEDGDDWRDIAESTWPLSGWSACHPCGVLTSICCGFARRSTNVRRRLWVLPSHFSDALSVIAANGH